MKRSQWGRPPGLPGQAQAGRPSPQRGFTLLEMLVATTILGIAVVGLMSCLSGIARNAARLREYDRAALLARLRMNDLLTDYKFPRGQTVSGGFDPAIAGGAVAGWSARVTTVEVSPVMVENDLVLDRIDLDVWWTAAERRRSIHLESYRRRPMTAEDAGGPK